MLLLLPKLLLLLEQQQQALASALIVLAAAIELTMDQPGFALAAVCVDLGSINLVRIINTRLIRALLRVLEEEEEKGAAVPAPGVPDITSRGYHFTFFLLLFLATSDNLAINLGIVCWAAVSGYLATRVVRIMKEGICMSDLEEEKATDFGS
jgi:hypothetical protein